MAARIFIDGAAGTTGLEIHQRLSGREDVELHRLPDELRKDGDARRDALNTCDIAILCLPDDAAREAVGMIDSDSTRVIDASSAHRVADGWTYGFPEIYGRNAIRKARFVSNPGCYPTGFLALVAPLVREGLLPADWPYSVHAVSGYSGGGNALIDRFETEGDLAWRGYGYAMGHKHLAEMQIHAGLAHPPLFAPAVVDAMRGMVVEVPLSLRAMPRAATAPELRNALAAHYRNSSIISVSTGKMPQELLLQRGAAPWDGMELFVFADMETDQVRLVARLDNLGKGASGAAVQSLNLMLGREETSGLELSA
ncbi:N-acetyl-gamma-glutamyl-phosphate reductase [Altererythrobacter sp. SALINAS58]|uniref:N-acetyl-gamma-glutamyl-phosphate reductase n=1 Tax=Alteripontixanthobacter muriae TaxID=2705546 RepID=UPI001575E453|nr:N-acetyl-gamma-glutamyl-phosphate reductase [Alteripontixanthobacter muriae]NTZ42213.1 N-acetyl-gamma-glutamyl-phosphate reductase [Alteripontixanthobacter muriae]